MSPALLVLPHCMTIPLLAMILSNLELFLQTADPLTTSFFLTDYFSSYFMERHLKGLPSVPATNQQALTAPAPSSPAPLSLDNNPYTLPDGVPDPFSLLRIQHLPVTGSAFSHCPSLS